MRKWNERLLSCVLLSCFWIFNGYLMFYSLTAYGESSRHVPVDAPDATSKMEQAKAKLMETRPPIPALRKIITNWDSNMTEGKLQKVISNSSELRPEHKQALLESFRMLENPDQFVQVIGRTLQDMDENGKGQLTPEQIKKMEKPDKDEQRDAALRALLEQMAQLERDKAEGKDKKDKDGKKGDGEKGGGQGQGSGGGPQSQQGGGGDQQGGGGNGHSGKGPRADKDDRNKDRDNGNSGNSSSGQQSGKDEGKDKDDKEEKSGLNSDSSSDKDASKNLSKLNSKADKVKAPDIADLNGLNSTQPPPALSKDFFGGASNIPQSISKGSGNSSFSIPSFGGFSGGGGGGGSVGGTGAGFGGLGMSGGGMDLSGMRFDSDYGGMMMGSGMGQQADVGGGVYGGISYSGGGGGDDGYSAIDGGGLEDPSRVTRKTAQSQILEISKAQSKDGRTMLEHFLTGRLLKDTCRGADAGKIAICYRAPSLRQVLQDNISTNLNRSSEETSE